MKWTLLLFLGLGINLVFSCKKDCLEKGKCELSTHQSSYVVNYETPPAQGTTYYIDAQNGKKKNSGTSEENAFKEIDNLSEIDYKAGDQILFKRGQIHYGVFEMYNGEGTAEKPIYISAYGTGALPVIKSEDATNGKSDVSTIALFLSNYVYIQNLNIHGGNNAILLSNANHAVIQGCRIGEQSNSGVRATGDYTEGAGSDFGIIRNCLIYSGRSGNTGDLQGTDGIQLLDGASEWQVYDNEVKAWAHSGILIKQIYTLNKSNDNRIYNNLIECGDIDYMRAFDISGGDNLAANNLIEKNIIRNQSVTSHIHGNGNIIAYNLFLGLKETEASEQPWGIDFHVFINNLGGQERSQLVCYDNAVYNNVFYGYENGVGIRFLKSKSGTDFDVHDIIVANNIFYNTGTSAEIDNEPTNIYFQNNLSYSGGTAAKYIFNETTYSLSAFEALSGTNGHTFTSNFDFDPQFTNLGTEDFHLMEGSAAIDAGIANMLPSDFEGNPIDANPDLGAFEY